MSELPGYLDRKRAALHRRQERIATEGPTRTAISARTTVAGGSGVRRVRIRDFQTISDSRPDFGGYDLGPSSPESQLGVLSSCLAHVFLIQAAASEIVLEAVEVEVTAEIPSGTDADGTPPYPRDITYVVWLTSPASAAALQALHERVEAACPILNLLTRPQRITGAVYHTPAAAPSTAAQEPALIA